MMQACCQQGLDKVHTNRQSGCFHPMAILFINLEIRRASRTSLQRAAVGEVEYKAFSKEIAVSKMEILMVFSLLYSLIRNGYININRTQD